MATISDYQSDDRGRPRSIATIRTREETAIYLLPVETFPNHINNIFFIDHPQHPTLFDVGTQLGNEQLEERFAELSRSFGVRRTLDDIELVVLSHAHIDHFGNARRFSEAGVEIAIHEQDARVLEVFSERLLLASRDVGIFLRQAGVSDSAVKRLTELYRFGKKLFSELTPDRRLRDGDRLGPGWEVIHVPGHCRGMICLCIDDVVLSADHVLARITPAQSPQSITPGVGLEIYLSSLQRLREAGPFDLALGAHEAPIADLRARIGEIEQHHATRLADTLACCRQEPVTVSEVSRQLFGEQRGYGVLLALCEAGAHVEYLHALGDLAIANIDEVCDRFDAPVRYLARPGPGRAPRAVGASR